VTPLLPRRDAAAARRDAAAAAALAAAALPVAAPLVDAEVRQFFRSMVESASSLPLRGSAGLEPVRVIVGPAVLKP
jgi:hypothetical protein